MSLNQWIAAAVAEKVVLVETAAEFFAQRRGKATGKRLTRLSARAPKRGPDAGDELPSK